MEASDDGQTEEQNSYVSLKHDSLCDVFLIIVLESCQDIACQKEKRNAELMFFVHLSMFLNLSITITQLTAKFPKISASDFHPSQFR